MRAGIGTLVMAIAAGLAGLAPAHATPAAATPAPVSALSSAGELDDELTDEDIETVVFDPDRYERMTVPVTIAGSGPYRFFIDTGAQATAVTHRITQDLGLAPRGQALLVAMGSQRAVDLVDVDQLEFADRVFSGIRAPLLKRSHIGADGILGLDSLQNLRVVIDFANDRMDVMDASVIKGGRGDFDIVVRARRQLGQMIITDAKVNGVRTAVVIDTGAQNTIANPALLARLRKRGDEVLVATDVNGVRFESKYVLARQIAMGGVRIHSAPVGFSDSPAFAALGLTDTPALILGMGNLRLFEQVAIDFAQQRILFALPDGAKRSFAEFGHGGSRIKR